MDSLLELFCHVETPRGAFTARGKANSHAENAENAERYRKHSVPTSVFCGPEAGRPEIALPLLVNAPCILSRSVFDLE